jgi:hypothetical protein
MSSFAEAEQSKKTKSPWIRISDGSSRLRVPGGWVIQSWQYTFQGGVALHQVFVADPTHEWVPEEQ